MLTVATLVCISLGLLNLWSAVRERQFHLFAQQLSWAAVGGLLFLAVASFDYRVIARMGYVLYGIGIALLVAVLIHGKMVGGSSLWPSTYTTPLRSTDGPCATSWCPSSSPAYPFSSSPPNQIWAPRSSSCSSSPPSC
jgi:hypothetical protein